MELDNQQQQQQQPDNTLISNKSKLAIITQPEEMYVAAHKIADKFASTVIGQYAIDKVDKILSIVEKTAKWGLPQSEPLDRPLPWLPFLATIITLRVIRISLSVFAILIGNEPITAKSLVCFIQTRRRKLRHTKHNGLRVIHEKQQLAAQKQTQESFIEQLRLRLATLLTTVLCRSNAINSNQNRDDNDKSVKIVYKKKSSKKQKALLNLENLVDDDDSNDIGGEMNIIKDLLNEHFPSGDDSKDSDYTLEEEEEEDEDLCLEETSETSSDENIAKNSAELKNRKKVMEKSTKFLQDIIQQKHEQLEQKIRNKLESEIKEQILLELAKINRKDSIESNNQQETVSNNSASKEHEEEEPQQQQQQVQQEQEKSLSIDQQQIEEENQEHLSNNIDNNSDASPVENPSSVSINPPILSPQIAQNGNINDTSTESSSNEQHKHNQKGFNKNNLTVTVSRYSSSSSEDSFYSPIDSPGVEKVLFENYPSSLQNKINKNDDMNIESSLALIENEQKPSLLQINSKSLASSHQQTFKKINSGGGGGGAAYTNRLKAKK